MNLIATAIEVKRTFRSHELQHRAVAGIAEGPLEVNLHVVWIEKERLHRVGRLPNAFARVVVADGCRLERMIEVEEPVGDVDEVNHQIGQDAAAEIPEPAPVAD